MKKINFFPVLFLLLALSATNCSTVTDYEVAVGQTRFTGSVHDNLYGQGLHSVFGKSLTNYSLREIQYPDEGESETLDVLSSDNMTINIDAAFRWRVEKDSVLELFFEIGSFRDIQNFVYNAYRSAVRDAISEQPAAEILSSERRGVGERVRALLEERLQPRGITVTDVFVRGIDPPPSLKKAIEEKLAREQQVQAEIYQTNVVIEQANQKREEAKGIRDSQNIIATSLEGERGERYLHWRYLEMLGKIGEGDNNMVIAPTEGGIPLFLGSGGK